MNKLAQVELLHLYISPDHNFVGHHGQPAGKNPSIEVREIHCLAGRGIESDRYIDFKEDYKGQITFFASEVYEALCSEFGVDDVSPSAFRRNVITRGIDLNTLIGQTFEIQGVQFEGVEECRPCGWMNEAFASGAEEKLRGNGGLRARILTDGFLHLTAEK